jgi:hypothetical protein
MGSLFGCVWIHGEGKIPATRLDLDRWMKTLPQPWTVAMEATIFTGWIYDHLRPHAEAVKVAHPLNQRGRWVQYFYTKRSSIDLYIQTIHQKKQRNWIRTSRSCLRVFHQSVRPDGRVLQLKENGFPVVWFARLQVIAVRISKRPGGRA